MTRGRARTAAGVAATAVMLCFRGPAAAAPGGAVNVILAGGAASSPAGGPAGSPVAGPAGSFPVSQGPAAPWRTLTTAHFRVHYPEPFAAWAARAAGELETERERAIAEIGFTPADVVDVVVSDPVADANGEALPLRGWPRLVLWTSPPPPDSEIGSYRDSIEDLVVHEEAHLVHLLRPSRNSLLSRLLPVSPIALGPRWLVEGYATLIEGRLTGAGRPNGDLRAAILRRWAQAGVLPDYGRLAADSHAWRGMSMAYLLGSAFLEWLEQRGGPGSLRKLWARMTARSGRSFDAAFAGIWENSPASLYDRFRAELTWHAMEAEKRVQAAGPLTVREGALWQGLSWTTGAPAVSPDGGQIALVHRSRDRPAELVIWSTAPDEEAERRWREAQARELRRDPQDVAAVRTRPLPRKPLHAWTAAAGGDPAMPRFMPGGGSLLLVRFLPDGEGFLHPDLFEWRPASGEMRRITRQADLRDPDPAPDGSWAVAVRDRYGLSQLVTVDLATGETRDLTPPSLDRIYDRPRVSPDGRRVAYGLHGGGGWQLAVMDLGADRTAGPGAETVLAPPPGATASSPAWSPDGGTLYAVVGRGGFIDLYAFAARGGAPPVALTRTQGGAFAPAPTPDGKALFYLSLEPTGLDLRRLDLAARRPPLAEVSLPADLAPAVRPPAPAAPPPPIPSPASPPAVQPYGLGRQELLPLVGGGIGSSGGSLALGVRGGDLLGRLDLLAIGAIGGDGALHGGALAGSFRGLPVEIDVQGFDVREQPSRQDAAAPAAGRPAPPKAGAGGALDLERRGLAAATEWRHQAAGERSRLGFSLLWQQIEPAPAGLPLTGGVPGAALAARALDLPLVSGPRTAPAPPPSGTDEAVAAFDGGDRRFRRYGPWVVASDLDARAEAGRSRGDSWERYGGDAGFSVRREDTRLAVGWRRDGSHQVTDAFDLYQLGGPASSLLPPAALAARIVSPALPAATLLGAEHEEERVELDLGGGGTAGWLGGWAGGGLPLPLFYERHRLWGGLLSRPAEVTLAGLEYRFTTRPVPLVRLPALELRLGAARLFTSPLAERSRWWLTSVWRP